MAAEPAGLEYNRDIRPILADACFACHGVDGAARQADLRLDLRQAAIDSGAIEPGKPSESSMIDRILTTDPERIMPPPKSHKKLSDAQKETLRKWVEQGADYQPHWSLIAPKKSEPPAVKNAQWVRNPIDQFILAQLEANGLSPAPEADLNTLARRAALDLTGLPPTPQQLAELRADQSPTAYENYVDRLLNAPEWGEHRGRYWLDYAGLLIRMAFTSTITARCGLIAIGSSVHSIATCPSINLRSSSWRVTCCPNQLWINASLPDSIAVTSRPTRAV